MTARVVFVERAKQLAIAVLWLLAFAGVALGVGFVLHALTTGIGGATWWLARDGAVQVGALFAATWLVGRRWAKRSWDQLGWHTDHGLAPRVLRGLGLGASMAALAVGLAFVVGRATVRLTHDWSRWPVIAVPLFVGLLLAALSEELLFRGFPLRRLADAIGPWAAMTLLAVGFGLAHLKNPSATVFSTINVALAGVWLSFAFFSHGGMGLAWGLHAGWNAGLALVFDAPVSGYPFSVPAVAYAPGRHPWVDGGAFGPEGGAVTTIVLIAGTLAVLGARFRRPKEWLAG